MNTLRQLVRTFELSQGDIAESIGVSRATVARVLNKETMPRNVTIKLLEDIAGVCGYRVKVLFEPMEANHDNQPT